MVASDECGDVSVVSAVGQDPVVVLVCRLDVEGPAIDDPPVGEGFDVSPFQRSMMVTDQ